jgi:hypothetical protein
METVLLFACVLVAVALSGANPLGFLVALAACQFVCCLAWFVGTSRLRYGH